MLASWESSSADVSDSRRVGLVVDGESDDFSVDVSVDISVTLLFAAAISFPLCSFAQSLAFLNAPAPCLKVSREPVRAQAPSWVMLYSGLPPGIFGCVG